MSQITRLYSSHTAAEAAVAELKSYRYQRIHVVSPPHPAAAGESELTAHDHLAHIEHALHRAGIPHTDAATYAPRIHEGATLVTLNAPFGEGSQAEVILDEHDPIDSGIHHSNAYSPTHAAPLSDALGWKLLINDPAPLSRALGLAPLSKKQNSTTALSNNPAPLSKATGLPTISNLTGLFGLPTLSNNPAPLSKMLGLPVLSSEPAPFSKALGWKTTSAEPAPLSKATGLPVLSEEDK